MKKGIAASLILALAVNAGVLVALPLLAGALETAMPATPRFDLRDLELVDLRDDEPAPLVRVPADRDDVRVKKPEQKQAPRPDTPPSRAEPEHGNTLPDLLKDIEFEFSPDALRPSVDLVLPAAALASGPGTGSGTTAADASPEKSIHSLDDVERLPVRVYHIEPVYPRWALEQEVEGEVTLSLTIGRDGAVGDVSVEHSSGYEDFDRAAVEAVNLWRFAPALIGNRAIAVRAIQKIRFSLR
jgi:TonB family protein